MSISSIAHLVFALALPAAAWAQASDLVIALDGAPPQEIARFAAGTWVRGAEPLTCAPRGAADRVVATGSGRLTAPPRITSSAAEWAPIEAAIHAAVERRGRDHSVTPANLARVPIHIDAVYAAAGRGRTAAIYYFEASRRVPDPGTAPEEDPKGTLRVTVSGWLQRQGTAVTVLGSKSELGWYQDDAGGAAVRGSGLVPLGVVAVGSRSIWVMKGGIGDIAWIAVYGVGEGGVRTPVDSIRCVR